MLVFLHAIQWELISFLPILSYLMILRSNYSFSGQFFHLLVFCLSNSSTSRKSSSNLTGLSRKESTGRYSPSVSGEKFKKGFCELMAVNISIGVEANRASILILFAKSNPFDSPLEPNMTSRIIKSGFSCFNFS